MSTRGQVECVNAKYAFLYQYACNTFISNTRLKSATNQVKAKQHPKAELLLFENYLLSSSKLSSRNDMTYSKKNTSE